MRTPPRIAAMTDPNFLAPEWETPPGMPIKGVRLGAAAGAQELGATLYELPPGTAVSPYHLHYGNEELLTRCEDQQTLLTDDWEHDTDRFSLAAAGYRRRVRSARFTHLLNLPLTREASINFAAVQMGDRIARLADGLTAAAAKDGRDD